MSTASGHIHLAPADATTRAVLDALGLTHTPFPQTPDAANYFQTADIERDLAEATHCLLARKGFVLLTGEVGQGKTTFLRRLLLRVERDGVRSSLIFNTFLQGSDLLAAVLRDFGLRPGQNAAANIARLNRFLLGCWREGTTCVLFIDDAQNLDIASLELLRLLTNLESGQEKLLQIVLAGQPELESTLQQHGLRQLASRIVKHVRLKPLDAEEMERYIAFRLTQAGDAGRIRVVPRARAALFRDSSGNPRRIHLLMDRCLYGVIARGRPIIDAALVRRASREAGFVHARRLPSRWLATASAVLVVAAGLATAANFRSQPVAAAQQLPQALAAPVVSAISSRFGPCVERAARSLNNEGQPLQVFDVPSHITPRLSGRSDVCIEQREEQTFAAWRPALALDQLAMGTYGDAVRVMQAQLVVVGAFASQSELQADPRDGHFGPQTLAALRNFQHQQRVPATGRADPLTLLLLDIASAPSSKTTHPLENPHGRA